MNRDEFITKIQKIKNSWKMSTGEVETIKECLTMEGIEDGDLELLYRLILRHYDIVGSPPGYHHIAEIWDKYGSTQHSSPSGRITKEYVMDRCIKMDVEQITKYVSIYRSKLTKSSYESIFIVVFSDVAHAYNLTMDKTGDRSEAVTFAKKVKSEIYGGTCNYFFEYINTENKIGVDEERNKKVVKSEEVINNLFGA